MMPDTHDLGRLQVHAVQLDGDAPIVHRAITAEYDHGGRNSNSWVIKTRFARSGRWHGIRKSWISVQVKLPTGERLASGVWGIVLGWWRDPDDDGWSALIRAIRMGKEPDGNDDANYEAPTSESIRGALIDVDRRRVADPDDAGAGQ